MIKKTIAIFVALILLLTNAPILLDRTADAATDPPKTQSMMVIVYSESVTSDPSAGTYWTQMDNGSFRAAWNNSWGQGEIIRPNAGTSSNPYPAEGIIPDDYDYGNQIPANWKPYNGLEIPKSVVSSVEIDQITFDTSKGYFTPDVDPIKINATTVKFKTKTGGYHTISRRTSIAGGKYQVLYETPVQIIWRGNITETKEIDVNPDSTMSVGQTKQLNASVRTKGYLESKSITEMPYVSVRSDPETTWTSSDSSIVSVTSTGFITAKKAGTAKIRATWKKDGYEISDIATITVGGPTPTPPPVSFTGDFDVNPANIEYNRNSFSIKPKNFSMNTCTYVSHQYKIERGGTTWTSSAVSGQTTTSTYAPGSYPNVIGVGTHSVFMKIKTSNCGESDWIGPKSLTVTGPTMNSPPSFQVGFVNPSNPRVPLTKVVEGTVLDLIYINDPTIPTPTDPEGDMLVFEGFDLTTGTNFIRTLSSRGIAYIDGYHSITMSELGFHHVTGIMRDEWGASSIASTYIEVVPKNPVPVLACPASVVANHPIPLSAYDASGSYSPVSGRTINHALNEWENRLTSFTNNTGSDITVTVSLHVYDNTGLKSLTPGTCTIIVKPDLPPNAKLQVPPVGIRNAKVDIVNISTSPDGDTIVSAEYKYKYDAHNNGFADDAWQPLAGTLEKTSLTPTKVGKYLFYIKVTESYGAWDDTLLDPTEALILDVVNDAPEVSFSLQGDNSQPEMDPYTVVSPEQMLQWTVNVTNQNKAVINKSNLWRAVNGRLVSGEGRNFGPQTYNLYSLRQTRFSTEKRDFQTFPMANNGYGNNRLSPWRSMTSVDYAKTYPIIEPGYTNYYQFTASGIINIPKLRSNKKLFFFDITRSGSSEYYTRIHAINPKKAPAVEMYSMPGGYGVRYANGETPYEFSIDVTTMTSRPFTYACSATYQRTFNVYPKRIVDWEVADRYLYVQIEYEGNVRDCSLDMTTFYELAVFDGYTGAKLSSSFDKPELMDLINQLNKKTLYRYYYSTTNYGANYETGHRYFFNKVIPSHSEGPNMIFTINVQGITDFFRITPELAMDKYTQDDTIPPPNDSLTISRKNGGATLNYTTSPLFFDAQGNMYRYGWYQDYYAGQKLDLHVRKYNTNFQEVWRTYLKPNKVASPVDETYLSAYSYTDSFPGLTINTFANEVYAKLFYDQAKPGNVIPDKIEEIAVLNMNTGAIKSQPSVLNGDDLTMYHYGTRYDGLTKYGINFDGTKSAGRGSTTTIDGNKTSYYLTDAREAGAGQAFVNGDNRVYDSNGQPIGYAGAPQNNGQQVFGEYFGDGFYVSLTNVANPYYPNETDTYRINISVGTPTTTPAIIKSFTNGQFMSNNSLSDADIKFAFQVEDFSIDQEWLGLSFRMQNAMNRYALETNGSKLSLAKYVSGVRTELKSINYMMSNKTDYQARIKFLGDTINVWINNAPVFEVTDTTYTTGKFGYFSDKALVTFGSLSYKPVTQSNPWSALYAIWDGAAAKADLKYDSITFSDPENDPPLNGAYNWTVLHTPKFINNQGLSALNGQTYTDVQLEFDKVGIFKVKLSAKDDPHPEHLYPDNTFDSYRKSSNEFEQEITVHRRPIADFTLAVAADKTVKWTDYSYDPDRYQSATVYDTEPTGIDYKTTRGILEKKFYYIAPSGTYSGTKLVTPTELGVYEIGMAVKDEFGAWSDWTVKSLTIGSLPSPNTPPVPGFTLSTASTYRGVGVTINSTAYDAEDGERTALAHEYYIRNTTTGGAETLQSASRTSWVKTFNTMGVFTIRQVIEDSKGAIAQMEKQITISNRLPAANITTPSSTNQNSPTKLTALRPTFAWTYSDADSDIQTQYQVRIYRYGGTLQQDSGIKTGSTTSWTPSVDLPELTNLYIQVRAFDGYDWGNWSSAKYFYIETNRPPIGEFTWTPSTVFEGDTVQFRSAVSDPDGDALAVQYEITGPSGTKSTSSYTFNSPYSANSGPSIRMEAPGNWTIRMTISDGIAPAVVVTKSVHVDTLHVAGAVKHTEAWESNRLAYNAKYDPDRPPSMFWAGEAFVLEAATTDIGASSQTKTTSVVVRMFDDNAMSLASSDTAKVSWSGLLRSSDTNIDFTKLADGNYTFVFTATYSNGTVKTHSVTITIKDSTSSYVQVHRLH